MIEKELENSTEEEQKMNAFYKTKTGSRCGHCGMELTYGNDAGNGFCVTCYREYDKN